MNTDNTPVIFIHGLWLHSASWQPWFEPFERAGYQPSAPGWPGDRDTVELTRANPDDVADKGIDDVVEHYGAIIDAMPEKPILIGHSFGGMIAQKLLGQDRARAAIGIDAAQIKGVLPLPLSALHATLPVFKNPANRHRSVALTAEEFRYSFGNALTQEESDQLFEQYTIPSPGKPLFEAAAANFSIHSAAKVNTENEARGPLLLVMGGQDHTVPEAITKSTLKQYRHSSAVTDLLEFEDRGHSLTIDSRSHEVADACLNWLDKQVL
jgi:pimeloyl-ACP methyl ester carboxylesterase